MDQETLEKILGRSEHSDLIDQTSINAPDYFIGKKILITGGNGSLGNALADWFDAHGIDTYTSIDINTDNKYRRIDHCDITDSFDTANIIYHYDPQIIFHFAAAKHAPEGEVDPYETFDINVNGTLNLINAKRDYTHLVLSSTCKSISPETCYGASKLIAERMVLNDGGSVARYFNVVQSSGNVFEIWENSGEPYFVTDCRRFFISLDEAIALTINAGMYGMHKRGGRFIVDPGQARYMPDICRDLYGWESYIEIPRRRGDRLNEPLIAPNETTTPLHSYLLRVDNYHDKV